MKLPIKRKRSRMLYIRIPEEVHKHIRLLATENKVTLNEAANAVMELGFNALKE